MAHEHPNSFVKLESALASVAAASEPPPNWHLHPPGLVIGFNETQSRMSEEGRFATPAGSSQCKLQFEKKTDPVKDYLAQLPQLRIHFERLRLLEIITFIHASWDVIEITSFLTGRHTMGLQINHINAKKLKGLKIRPGSEGEDRSREFRGQVLGTSTKSNQVLGTSAVMLGSLPLLLIIMQQR